MDLLSDRRRPVLAALLVVCAVVLVGWWIRAIDLGRLGDQRVLASPDGTTVVLSLLRVRSIVGPDRFVVGSATLDVPIEGPTADLVVGQELYIGGTVVDGRVVQAWREGAPNRPAKWAFGLLGVAAAALLAVGAVTPTRAGLVVRG